MAVCDICNKESESCDDYESTVICKGCFFALSSRFVNREKRIGRKLRPEEKIKIMKAYMSDIGRQDCNVTIDE